MRKYDFAWVLPLTMAVVVLAIGFVLLGAAGLVSSAPPAPLVCGNTPEPASLAAQVDSADLATLVAGVDPGDAAVIQAGNALFTANCAQCHALNDVVVEPALMGITERRPVSWIIPWVKNSSKMVAAGDEYGGKIFDQYQKQQMPSFQLTDQEIKSIVAYIEAATDKALVVAYVSAVR